MRRQSSFLLLLTSVIFLILFIVILNKERLKAFQCTENICSRQYGAGKICDESTILLTLDEILVGPLAQNDSRIINYIHENNFLREPSNLPYNLISPVDDDPSMGQSRVIKDALRGMRNGFFVECGALDGEHRSNTLILERDYGWNGLLVEADPKNYENLLKKNRKAWSSSSCLAIKDAPHQVIFQQQGKLGKISNEYLVDSGHIIPAADHARVQCFPLFSLLSALNVTRVDYFSLDAEGSELAILHTIPFDAIYFKTISVEYNHVPGGREAVLKFMEYQQFRIIGEVHHPDGIGVADDLIFMNENLE